MPLAGSPKKKKQARDARLWLIQHALTDCKPCALHKVSSVPIVTCDGYFEGLLGLGHPLPCVHEWRWHEVAALMDAVERDSDYACSLERWYKAYRLTLAAAFKRALISDS